MRAIRKRHLLSHQMALLAVSRSSLSFERARHVSQSRAGRGSSARFTERGRRAWGAALAGRHGRVSPRRVFCEVRLRGARGARARVDRVGAAPESDERSLRVESAGGGGRGVGDARPGSSARGRAVGHGHAACARQRDAPARARRARDARRRAGRVSSVFEARCGCASRRLGLCARGVGAGGDVRLFFGAIAVSGRGGRRETERPRGDETSRVADGGVFGVFVPSPRRRGRRARDERRVERKPLLARVRARGGAPRIVGAPARPRGARVRDRPMVRPHHSGHSVPKRGGPRAGRRVCRARAPRAPNGPRRAAARDRARDCRGEPGAVPTRARNRRRRGRLRAAHAARGGRRDGADAVAARALRGREPGGNPFSVDLDLDLDVRRSARRRVPRGRDGVRGTVAVAGGV